MTVNKNCACTFLKTYCNYDVMSKDMIFLRSALTSLMVNVCSYQEKRKITGGRGTSNSDCCLFPTTKLFINSQHILGEKCKRISIY